MDEEKVWESVLEVVQRPVIGAIIQFKWGFMANPDEREKWDGDFSYTESGWVVTDNHSGKQTDYSDKAPMGLYNIIVEFSCGKPNCVQVIKNTHVER